MRRAACSLVAVVLAGCGVSPDSVATDDAYGTMVAAEQPPERFSFGAPADSSKIVAWDVDVRPDGVGLPPGRGTVEEGARVYQQHCAACHGPTGTEGRGGRLVGTEPWEDFPASRTVGNYWPYATTLYDYIVRAMPLTAPGTLTADQTYAVIAYLLHLNEIVPADAVMDAAALAAVQMPARNRFVPDDRTGGPVVR